MDEAEEMDVFVQEDEVMTARDLQEQLMQAQHEQRFAVELLERLKSDYDETLVENEEKDNMIRRLEVCVVWVGSVWRSSCHSCFWIGSGLNPA